MDTLKQSEKLVLSTVPDNLFEYAKKNPALMSPSTRTDYRRSWNKLLSKPNSPNFVERVRNVAQWIADDYYAKRIKYSTFRHYRSVVYFGLSTLFDSNHNLYDEYKDSYTTSVYYDQLYQYLKNIKPLKSDQSIALASPAQTEKNADHDVGIRDLNKQKNTSSLKLKSFPEPIFKWLCNIDSDLHTTKNTLLLQKFLTANVLVGLRPVEWLRVQFANCVKTKTPVLIVQNAKNSQGRANGEHRILILKDATLEERRALVDFKRAFDDDLAHELSLFQEKCRVLLATDPEDQSGLRALGQRKLDQQHGSSKTWNPVYPDTPLEELVDGFGNIQPAFAQIRLSNLQRSLNYLLHKCPHIDVRNDLRPTLYSTRHQAIANAKASKISAIETAAFFGHASPKTASVHYGKAHSGNRKFTFYPAPESIALVRQSTFVNSNDPTADKAHIDYDLDFW